MTPRLFSFGGGVQSTAVLVLASQGRVQYDAFVFANVGEDSEHPDTIAYLHQVAMPFAQRHNIELLELRRETGDGKTLYQQIQARGFMMPIPARVAPSGAPQRRICTFDFKTRVVAKELRRRGASKKNPGVVGLGISVDEFHRANNGTMVSYQTQEYPLLDLRMTRADCQRLILEAGLPMAPKSACYFCPYHNHEYWQHLRASNPDLFDRAVDVERELNAARQQRGMSTVYLHRSLIALEDAVDGRQPGLFDAHGMDNCESGYCGV